ncbi:terminal uridylyltransferase Tailor-like [Drosophila kikkawai]|uniref:Terminal uridylyltransferase Tailor-like n=1 Tax=Drosophila kikkawai TaxID=30033 RepID=A0A6P4J5R9_DROKI|nr:terminal uridylyltransferase Tailor-like [Drosophila kikkawai]
MDLGSIYFWDSLKKDVDKAIAIKTMGHDQIISDLKKALCSDFPDTPIYTFGSRIMGLASDGSDLDIYVHAYGNDVYTDKPTHTMLTNQMKIANAIRMSSENWIFIRTVDGMCPLVVVRHKPTNIMCDISFSRKISADQNNLVNYIFELQPIARYMVTYLRGWAQKHGLTKFRGHIFILMVIFFLQIRGKLPSIKDLQANLPPNFGPWKTNFVKLGLSSFNMKTVALNESEVRNILKDFFGYYSEFNYAQLIVCPWLGKELRRTMIQAHMPSGSQRYYCLYVSDRHAIIVQDMMHLNQNKAFPIAQHDLRSFKAKCKDMKMNTK